MNLDFRDQVFKAGFRPTADVDEFESHLRAKLGLRTRYEYARLCMGRSLALPSSPEPVPSDADLGKPISGELLFGSELDLWIAIIVMDGALESTARIEDFRALVQAHWCRGARRIREELSDVGDDETRLMIRLAELLPESPLSVASTLARGDARIGEVKLRIGSVSRTYPDDKETDFTLNGQATAPHIALMGKVGSGKTTTGVQIAQQIADIADIPMLFIDPKGEFVTGDRLVGPLGDMASRPTAIEVGQHPIPLDFLPPSGVGSTTITQAAMQFRDSIALCCKSVGNLQQDQLRTAVEAVIRSNRRRDLAAIRSQYEQNLTQAGKQSDSVISRLNELTALNVFEPSLSTSDFFGRSWIISLKTIASEELKRLVILLLLDALKGHVLSQEDTYVRDGFRCLRHLLVIDEARRILAQERYQSLVDLVRQGRSKGQVVLLLSQDPSDFEGKADDFTSQLGTVISFACSQSQRGLKALQGPFGRKLQPQEFSDTYLPAGVAFVKLPGRLAERIKCWAPIE